MNSYTLIPIFAVPYYFTFVLCPEKPGSFPLSIFEELNLNTESALPASLTVNLGDLGLKSI